MNLISKPVYKLMSVYFEQLFNNPLRTNAISGALVGLSGNYASQFLAGKKIINQQSLLAYAAFGLLFGSTIPHFFYLGLEHIIPEESAFTIAKGLIVERLIYTPLFQAFYLYTLARFEGKTHKEAMRQLENLYVKILITSWKFITIIEAFNQMFMPPMIRVFIHNLIGFFWTIYVSNKRRQEEIRAGKAARK